MKFLPRSKIPSPIICFVSRGFPAAKLASHLLYSNRQSSDRCRGWTKPISAQPQSACKLFQAPRGARMINRTYRSTRIVQQETGALANERSARNELPETEALRRARRGDSEAFERLYQLHGRRIYALCLRMVANPIEAEDLTQEAFLRGFRKIRSFRGDSAFSTWLHRVAVNVVLMHLR